MTRFHRWLSGIAEDAETVELYRALAVAIADTSASLADSLVYIRLLNTTADSASDSVTAAEQALQRVQDMVDHAQVIALTNALVNNFKLIDIMAVIR